MAAYDCGPVLSNVLVFGELGRLLLVIRLVDGVDCSLFGEMNWSIDRPTLTAVLRFLPVYGLAGLF